jgi:hypothetical protein
MKNITLLVLVGFISCNKYVAKTPSSNKQNSEYQNSKSFSWLMGVWERSMSGDEQMNHFETWLQQPNGLKGTGTTIIGDDVTYEQIWIYSDTTKYYYKAHPAQNPGPTIFTMTEIKDSSFRCENNQHDFPKYIEYKRSGDSLYTFIGDETQRIQFKFKLQNERNTR